jgi:phage portal protein BeeE
LEDRSTIVLPAGASLNASGALADPTLDELGQTCEANICAAFNVPPMMVGVRAGLMRSIQANYEEARRSLYSEAVQPLLSMLSRTFTRDLGEPIEFTVPEPEDPAVKLMQAKAELEPAVAPAAAKEAANGG